MKSRDDVVGEDPRSGVHVGLESLSRPSVHLSNRFANVRLLPTPLLPFPCSIARDPTVSLRRRLKNCLTPLRSLFSLSYF